MSSNFLEEIIKELHDQFLPNLMSIIYEIEYWEKVSQFPENTQKYLTSAKKNLQKAVENSRKFLLKIKPLRIVEKSLPHALNYYLKKFEKSRGLKYCWVTPPPQKHHYKNQDSILLLFLELVANMPSSDDKIYFAFRPSKKNVEISFSWSGLTKKWFSGNFKKVIESRLKKCKGKISFKKSNKKLWLSFIVPQ